MTKLTLIYRPIIITNFKARALKDRATESIAYDAVNEAVKADAEKLGRSEGYVMKIMIAKKVKEGADGTQN
jgi:hypothetical protein